MAMAIYGVANKYRMPSLRPLPLEFGSFIPLSTEALHIGHCASAVKAAAETRNRINNIFFMTAKLRVFWYKEEVLYVTGVTLYCF
jgi:hypothetical protein